MQNNNPIGKSKFQQQQGFNIQSKQTQLLHQKRKEFDQFSYQQEQKQMTERQIQDQKVNDIMACMPQRQNSRQQQNESSLNSILQGDNQESQSGNIENNNKQLAFSNPFTENKSDQNKRPLSQAFSSKMLVQNLDCMKKTKVSNSLDNNSSWEGIEKKEGQTNNASMKSLFNQFKLQKEDTTNTNIVDIPEIESISSFKKNNSLQPKQDQEIKIQKKQQKQSAIQDYFKNKNKNSTKQNEILSKRSNPSFEQNAFNRQGGANILAPKTLQPTKSFKDFNKISQQNQLNLQKKQQNNNTTSNSKNNLIDISNRSNSAQQVKTGPIKGYESNKPKSKAFSILDETEEEKWQKSLQRSDRLNKQFKKEQDKKELKLLMKQKKQAEEKKKQKDNRAKRANFMKMTKKEDEFDLLKKEFSNNSWGNQEKEDFGQSIKKKQGGSDQKEKKQHQSFFEKDYEKTYAKSQMEQKMDEIYFSGGYESYEDRTNYNALIIHLLQRDYNDEKSLNQESKQIPNKFFSYKEYNIIFQYLFVNECVAKFYQTIQTFKKSTNFGLGQPCHIKLSSANRNQEGFTVFNLGVGHKQGGKYFYKKQDKFQLKSANSIEDGELNDMEIEESQQQYEFDLKYQKNYIMIISSEKDVDLEKLSNTKFRDPNNGQKQFLFLGWLIPPNPKQLDEPIKLKTEVDGQLFQSICLQGVINCYIYPMEKVSTFIREYLAIKNMHYQEELMRILTEPEIMVEERFQHVVDQPMVLEKFFERTQSQYNTTQFKIIREICLTKSGLCMVQGPPGTGKTHTLIGLVSGLFYYQKNAGACVQKQKIMICAPSNTAIDEVIERIGKQGLFSSDGTRQKVNIVRVGILGNNASETVTQTCLEYQSQQRLNALLGKESNQTSTEIKQFIADYNEKLQKLGKVRCSNVQQEQENLKEINRITELRRQKYNELSKVKGVKVKQKQRYNEIMDQILLNADIICCTLNSSATEKLARFRNEIDVLIIDEAAQATEPNTLIPLQYGPKKVVLVGDPKQLPATTFSSDSHTTRYNRSLFERILDNNVPPYFLDIQYRMHPDIRSFPSDMFYDNRLQDADFIEKRSMPNFLKELKEKNIYFIDVLYSRQKMVDKSYENEYEAFMIVKFLKHFLDKIKQVNQGKRDVKDSIGIITPYKQQNKKIKNIIKSNMNSYQDQIKKQVLINTVDSFQGQEKDLILFSTVRSAYNTDKLQNQERDNIIGFLADERRMNVALTRARHGLLIFGNSETLSSDDNWSQLIEFLSTCGRYIKVNTQDEGKQLKNQFMKDQVPSIQQEYIAKTWMKRKKQKVDTLNILDFQEGENDAQAMEEEEEEDVQIQEEVQIVESGNNQKLGYKQKSNYYDLEAGNNHMLPQIQDIEAQIHTSDSDSEVRLDQVQFKFNKKSKQQQSNNKKESKISSDNNLDSCTMLDNAPQQFGQLKLQQKSSKNNSDSIKSSLNDITQKPQQQNKSIGNLSEFSGSKSDFKLKKKSNTSSSNNLKIGKLDIQDVVKKNNENNQNMMNCAMGLDSLLNGDFDKQNQKQ